MNSLSAIAGHEGDEEDLDWEREMRGLRNEEEVSANFLLLTTNHIISFFLSFSPLLLNLINFFW